MYLRRLIVAVSMLASLAAYALPSTMEVEAAVGRGDYATAEQMTREVIAANPRSAKAHYIYAELLAHDGNLSQARAEEEQARAIDPAITFTSPARFNAFEARLDARASAARSVVSPLRPTTGSGGGVLMLFFGLVLSIGVIALIAAVFRRSRGVMPMGYEQSPMNPGSPFVPYGPAPPMGGGIGSSVAAGLGGLAAGMMLERAIDGPRDERIVEVMQPVDQQPLSDQRDDPIDFGTGNDWGGDGGGGGGGGFDSGSGGGSDW